MRVCEYRPERPRFERRPAASVLLLFSGLLSMGLSAPAHAGAKATIVANARDGADHKRLAIFFLDDGAAALRSDDAVRYLARRLLEHQGFVTASREEEADWVARIDYGTVVSPAQLRVGYFPDPPDTPRGEGEIPVVEDPGLIPSGMNVSMVEEFERYVSITVYDALEFSCDPDTEGFVWQGSVTHDNVNRADPADPDELFSWMTAALCDHFGLKARRKVKLRRYRHTVDGLVDPD